MEKHSFPGTYQVLNDLLDALLGCLHTVLGSLEGDFVALGARAGEADHHTTVLISDLTQNLPPPDDEVAVVLGVNHHGVFNHIILPTDDSSQSALPFLAIITHLLHSAENSLQPHSNKRR